MSLFLPWPLLGMAVRGHALNSAPSTYSGIYTQEFFHAGRNLPLVKIRLGVPALCAGGVSLGCGYPLPPGVPCEKVNNGGGDKSLQAWKVSATLGVMV